MNVRYNRSIEVSSDLLRQTIALLLCSHRLLLVCGLQWTHSHSSTFLDLCLVDNKSLTTHWTRRYRRHAIVLIVCTTSSFCQEILEQAILVVHMPTGAPIRWPNQDISRLILAEANGTAVRGRRIPSRKLDHPRGGGCCIILVGSDCSSSILQVNGDCRLWSDSVYHCWWISDSLWDKEVVHRKSLGGWWEKPESQSLRVSSKQQFTPVALADRESIMELIECTHDLLPCEYAAPQRFPEELGIDDSASLSCCRW